MIRLCRPVLSAKDMPSSVKTSLLPASCSPPGHLSVLMLMPSLLLIRPCLSPPSSAYPHSRDGHPDLLHHQPPSPPCPSLHMVWPIDVAVDGGVEQGQGCPRGSRGTNSLVINVCVCHEVSRHASCRHRCWKENAVTPYDALSGYAVVNVCEYTSRASKPSKKRKYGIEARNVVSASRCHQKKCV